MGNARSSSSRRTSKNFDRRNGSKGCGKNELTGSDHVDKEKPPPMTTASGAEGLNEMRFEYKLVRCKEHTTTSDNPATCYECATRLFHIESGTMITNANRKEYIPDGLVFDVVSDLCQEIAQERVQKECGLKFITVHENSNGESIEALVENDYDKQQQQRPTFLFITGKGKSRAGVVSVKEVLVSGMEKGSALYHLREAHKRGLATICLDPNALGHTRGMETVDKSLTSLFHSWENAPVYVLAHSAAGGYLVRYLLLGSAKAQMMQNIRIICFTDSTHRIQWARDDPTAFSFLQSPSCLYIRNDTAFANGTFERRQNAEAGEEAQVDIWWKQRFGELPTVWAGTTSHSAMCWVARQVIWDLFDNNIPTDNETGNIER